MNKTVNYMPFGLKLLIRWLINYVPIEVSDRIIIRDIFIY